MFNLPQTAFVNRIIPKNRFNNLKEIQKIIWLYNLSDKTINLSPTQNIKEIQIFKIESSTIPKKELLSIQNKIPYPILFVLADGYGMFDNNQFFFAENINPNFTANNIEELYQNILKSFFTIQTEDFETSKEIETKINSLQKEINTIQSKIKKEKQFKYKVELNKQLIQLQKELKRLKGQK